MMSRSYRIRYHVEPEWNGPPAIECKQTEIAGIRVSPDNFGYADSLFVASILKDHHGTVSSVLLMDSETGAHPSREILEIVKREIEHYLEQHA